MINNTAVDNKHPTKADIKTVYPITFSGATDSSGLPMFKVTLTYADGSSKELAYNIDYALVYDDVQENNNESFNKPHLNGIKFLLPEYAVDGNTLYILRTTPFVQPVDFQIGRIDPEQIEKIADLSVLRDQELRNQANKDRDNISDLYGVTADLRADVDAAQKSADDAMAHSVAVEKRVSQNDKDIANLFNKQASHNERISEIESKVPESASETNQLATKADLKNIDIDGYVKKSGDTMTGSLAFEDYSAAHPQKRVLRGDGSAFAIEHYYNNEQYPRESWNFAGSCFFSYTTTNVKPYLGTSTWPWDNVYAKKLNNGADVAIPTVGGTLARLEDVATKQDKLIAGDNIIIRGNVISATGAGGGAGLSFIVCDTLPETGESGIIYLVPKDGQAPDVYNEYVWIASTQTFELIGSTQVDLTDYATKGELAGYLPSSGGDVTGHITFSGGWASTRALRFDPLGGGNNSSMVSLGCSILHTLTLSLGGDNGTVRFGESGGLSATQLTLGDSTYPWKLAYIEKLNNGADLIVPTEGGTLARLEDLEGIGGEGAAGQVLTKTDTGMAWQEAQAGGTKITIIRYDE